MLINRIAEKIHIKSIMGQSIFGSILIGLFTFILLSGISYNMNVNSGESCHPFRGKVYHFVSLTYQYNIQNKSGSFQPESVFFDFLIDSPFRSIL